MQLRSTHFLAQLSYLGLALLLALTALSCSRSSTGGGYVALAVPQNVTAGAVSSTQVNITWTDDEFDGTFVEIDRSTDQLTFDLVAVTETVNLSHVDTVPAAGDMTYYYRVRSRNNNDDGTPSLLSDYSGTVVAITMAPPTGLSADAISGSQIDIQWTDNSGLEDGYAIERSADGGAFAEVAQVPADTGTYSDIGIAGGTLYAYKVRAFNEGGNTSDYSGEYAESTPITPWAKSYGGTDIETAGALMLTSDKGYILAGDTKSFGQNGDMWYLKAAMEGDVDWQWSLGGSNYDFLNAAAATSDGGHILAGGTDSFGSGKQDMWIVKLDATQRIDWQKTYGLAENDYANVIIPLDDGYLVAGDTETTTQGYDIWVMKLDFSGALVWVRTLGGLGNDLINSVVQIHTGAFLALGSTRSYGAGMADYWLALINPDGTVEGDLALSYGGLDFDWAQALIQTKDRGYVLAGETKSWGTDGDAWILKLTPWGDPQWQVSLGGTGVDKIYSIIQTQDEGFIAVGITYSYGYQGSADAWVIKLDSAGTVEWQFAYGGPGTDLAENVGQLVDSGYIITGQFDSGATGTDSVDMWAVKVSEEGEVVFSSAGGAVQTASMAVASNTAATVSVFNPVLPDTTPTLLDSTAVLSETDCTVGSQTE